jgi:hypothetical protein
MGSARRAKATTVKWVLYEIIAFVMCNVTNFIHKNQSVVKRRVARCLAGEPKPHLTESRSPFIGQAAGMKAFFGVLLKAEKFQDT